MTDSQSRKRKREPSVKQVSSKPNAIKQPGRQASVAPTQPQSKILYKPRRKSLKAQLPRPKRPVTFSLPKHLSPHPSTDNPAPSGLTLASRATKSRGSTPSNTPTNTDTPEVRLLKTQLLLTRIHHRNKNQHRAQPFYKHLNLLRRALSRLIELHAPPDRPSQPLLATGRSTATKKSFTSTSTKSAPLSAEQTRVFFERQAELRSQREALESWIRETLVPGCYVAFSSLISDSQFANLGVVLMGCLVDVVGEVGLMKTIERIPVPTKQAQKTVKSPDTSIAAVEGWSTVITGPDVGVVVRRVYEGSDQGTGNSNQNDLGQVVERQRGTSPREEDMSLLSDTPPKNPPIRASKRDQTSRVAAKAVSQPSSTKITERPGLDQPLATIQVSELPRDQPDNINTPISQRGNATSTSSLNPNVRAQNPTADVVKSKLTTGARTSSKHERTRSTDTQVQHRESMRSEPGQNRVETSGDPTRSEPQTTEKKGKKRKKKGDAIDELFSGF